MSSLVILSLGQGTLQDGFPAVTAQLGQVNSPYRMKVTASLPAASQISEIYHNWQLLYSVFYQRLSLRLEVGEIDDCFEIAETYVTNVSEADIKDLYWQLANKINAWLNSTQFRKIDQQLRTRLKSSEEIHFIIETNDNLLRRLPWHLWTFFQDYPYAEVALSASEYQQPNKITASHPRERVRILAIFGTSKGIDISQDRKFIEKLSTQAEIEFLLEPQLTYLNDRLWQQGWNILFFAGHSSSQGKGLLHINQTDTITLDQLKYALKQAISRGLKLAIFNSCDGLGLAQQLQDLQIPQVIVMREPVLNIVAQEFLKHFLAEFSRRQSLYLAVRSARERLHVLEEEYPCATWLPVVCQNPAEPSMLWTEEGVKTELADKVSSVKVSAVPKTSSSYREIRSSHPFLLTRHNSFARYLFSIKSNRRLRTLLITSLLVAFSIVAVRYQGLLQPWELQAFDRLVQMSSADEKLLDPRLLIVTIDEADIQYQIRQKMNMRWSLSDQALTQLLQKLEQYQPRTIGIDVYRDFSVDPNYPDLANRLQRDKRLFAVCKVSAPSDGAMDGTLPPPEVSKERLGLSDFVADEDDVPRRQLLHLTPPLKSPCAAEYAFSYQLARHYLNTQGFKPEINSQGNLQIGNVVFQQLKSHTSGYQGVDASGYQILFNYHSLSSLQKIAPQVLSLTEVLNDQINPELVKSVQNRIVLIGVTAPSTQDYWKTPYSASTADNQKEIPGVFVQAQMVSHILSAVLDRRPLLWWWSGWVEAFWIWGWSFLGGIIAWCMQRSLYLGLAIAIGLLVLFSICFSIFTQAGWIPLVPAGFALMLCALVLRIILPPHASKSKTTLRSEL